MNQTHLRLKVTDSFYIKTDRYNYILIEKYMAKDKDGNPKMREHKQFFPNLEQCLRRVRECEGKFCHNFDELYEVLQKSYVLDAETADSVGSES